MPQVCVENVYAHHSKRYSDISLLLGIGVRIAVYVQALLPSIALLAEVLKGRPFHQAIRTWERASKTITPALLTGMALIVSAIIQQHKYGLSVFHAMIVLNLCWITIATACGFFFVAPDSTLITVSAVKHDLTVLKIFLLTILQCELLGGFGIWVFSTIHTFDSSSHSCTPSTVVWIFGHHIPVTSIPFRRLMLALYWTTSIPGYGQFILFLSALICAIPFVALRILHETVRGGSLIRALRIGSDFNTIISYNAVIAILILMTEMTIRSNHVTSEEQQWGLGQTCALMVTLFSTSGIVPHLLNMDDDVDGSTDVRSVPHVGDDQERGLYSGDSSHREPGFCAGTGQTPTHEDHQQNHRDGLRSVESNPEGQLNPRLSLGPRRRGALGRSRSNSI